MPSHRTELRDHAPRIEVVQIDPEKIGALIGPVEKISVELLKSLEQILTSMKIIAEKFGFTRMTPNQ